MCDIHLQKYHVHLVLSILEYTGILFILLKTNPARKPGDHDIFHMCMVTLISFKIGTDVDVMVSKKNWLGGGWVGEVSSIQFLFGFLEFF